MQLFVYILQCADGSCYTGCTTKLEQRIAQHKAGTMGGYTSTRLPVECVWVAEFKSLRDAIDFERKLKRWSRVKKEAVISGAWSRLPTLAKRGFRPRLGIPASFETPTAWAPQDDEH